MRNLIKHPNKKGLHTLLLTTILFIVITWPLHAQAPTEIDRLTHAITTILKLEPRHYLLKDSKKCREVATEIIIAAAEAEQDPYIIAAMAFHESGFKPHLVGKSNGETGVMQMHGRARKLCKRWKLDITKRSEQFRCGAHYLRYATAVCQKGLEAGLTVYAIGTCNAPKDSRAAKAVRRRLRTAEKMRSLGTEKKATHPDT